ncbi:hypothetical protein NM688_g2285 [Phlebia brevispora]|uniref:Uncharacterized protein n=1 Tax=Phlebia brevispora TaxID=194682 RepID=A0ACC1T995_9APHY|nr:hypothetical protein NM688_g2285 [Phlebia brevispora]
MTRHALSIRQQKIRNRRAENRRLADAVDAYQQEQQKPKPRGLRVIAQQYGIPKSNLQRAVDGQLSMSAFNAKKQLLTPEEERVIVDYILEASDRGLPPTHRELETVVNELLAQKHTDPGTSPQTCGVNWTSRFLDRHDDELQTHWSHGLDTLRAGALNAEVLKHWFEQVVKKRYVDAGFLPENTYGMDESGFPREANRVQRVLGRRGKKRQHKLGTANRENTTVLVTICADGTALKPLIIFKAKNFRTDWRDDNVAGASFACSENGWTDGEIAASWLIDDFDKQTRDKAAGKPRALFVDGHNSHYSKKLLDYAQTLNIMLIGYPPHCTHALQGLDVACFGCMKEEFALEVERFEAEHDRGVNKADFAGVFGRAYLRAFSESTIKSAFAKTGIYPYNPGVIEPKQTKPAEALSIDGGFPMPQASPVRAVMQALYDHPPTAFEIDPETHTEPSLPLQYTLSSNPQTPRASRKRTNENLDSTPGSPTKRRRLLISELSHTNSGRVLIDNSQITSQLNMHNQPIPSPSPAALSMIQKQKEQIACLKAALAQRKLKIQAQNAQMVMQGLYLRKLNRALRGKESKSKSNRKKLFPGGKGRVLTDEDFVEEIGRMDEQKEAKKAKTAKRGEEKIVKDAEKVALDQAWAQIKEEHIKAVAAWKAECERLIQHGMLRKDLPKKPKRQLKPKTLLDLAPEVSEGEAEEWYGFSSSGEEESEPSDDEDGGSSNDDDDDDSSA